MIIYAIIQLENDRQETTNVGIEVLDENITKTALVPAMKGYDIKQSMYVKYSNYMGSLDSLEETFEFVTKKFLGNGPLIVKETRTLGYKTKKERITNLANYAHNAWSGWMKYLFSKNTLNQDGSFTIPKDLVERWVRQSLTPYSSLSESEQKSDIEEANKIMLILRK